MKKKETDKISELNEELNKDMNMAYEQGYREGKEETIEKINKEIEKFIGIIRKESSVIREHLNEQDKIINSVLVEGKRIPAEKFSMAMNESKRGTEKLTINYQKSNVLEKLRMKIWKLWKVNKKRLNER